MKYMIKAAALVLCGALLCGCNRIDYGTEVTAAQTTTTTPEVTTETTTAATEPIIQENKLTYKTQPSVEFAKLYEAEEAENAVNNQPVTSLYGYSGDGYVQLGDDNSITFTITVPAAQHYDIAICSVGFDAIVELQTDNGTKPEVLNSEGAYYIKDVTLFTSSALSGIYLREGENKVTLHALSGRAYVDYLTLKNSENSSSAVRYKISAGLINKNASLETSCLMDYLSDTYGKQVLTGQYCTPNTNAELNAVYETTGRYPAIRCGDMADYSLYYDGNETPCELELCQEWAEKGGIVSLSWSWLSPSDELSSVYADKTDFLLDDAFTKQSIALMEPEEIQALYENGRISEGCYRLIADIDNMAEKLKTLDDANIPVLWRPLMEAGGGWYWWGNCTAESYVWLWRLMVERMNNFHKLGNLIWVWNGESYDYYPGDDYVDIIGEDIYNMTDATNAPRFAATSYYSISYKAAALSECGKLPDPDKLFRDNVLWLWFSLWRGNYIVNNDGSFCSDVNSAEALNKVYNHSLTVTLDELPELGTYGIIE